MEQSTITQRSVEDVIDSLEAGVRPCDRVRVYLNTMVSAASHLDDIMSYFAQTSCSAHFRERDVFRYVEASVRRLAEALSGQNSDARANTLIGLLSRGLSGVGPGVGDAQTAWRYSGIFLVAAVTIARAVTGSEVTKALGVQTAYSGATLRLPFPVKPSSHLDLQIDVVTRNFQWLCDHVTQH